MKITEESQLSYYFNRLDEIKMLTRKEETALLVQIETSRDDLIKKCSNSMFFRKELLSILNGYKTQDLMKVTRLLDTESTKKDFTSVKKLFTELKSKLNSQVSQDLSKDLTEFKLSGNVIHALIDQIKAKYDIVRSNENRLKSMLKYFECNSEDELAEIVSKIKTDKNIREYYQLKFYTTGTKLLSRCQDYIEYTKSIKKSLKTDLLDLDISEIKRVYKIAIENEHKLLTSRNILVEKNLRLVVSRAKKFINKGLDFEDLIQEGNIGLVRAINKHDSSRGVKVATYATWWIDQAIRRAISNKRATVRIPTHIEFKQTTLINVRASLTALLGREPTNQELADKADMDVEQLNKLDIAAMHRIGLEDENDSGISLLDIIPDSESSSPFDQTHLNLVKKRIRDVLSMLTPNSEKILRLRYGIGEPVVDMTLQEIADKMKLSKMGVKLSVDRSLKSIKNSKKLDDLKED